MEDYLEEYKKNNKAELLLVQKKLEKSSEKKPPLTDYFLYQIKGEIVSTLGTAFKAEEGKVREGVVLELPPGHITADLTFSVFRLTEVLGEKNPHELVKKVAAALNESPSKLYQPVEVVGAFINFKLKDDILIQMVLGGVGRLGAEYGASDADDGHGGNASKNALIEYSSPNIAKPIGVGHMRSTIIGQALVNIFKSAGYRTVIRHNYLGDWGTQFGKLAYAYQLWGKEEMLQNDALRNLKDLYVRFHEEAEKDPTLEDRGRELAKRLELGDPELLQLWAKFRKISIDGFEKTFDRLGVEFDVYLGESYFGAIEEKEKLVEVCLEKGIAHIDEASGAVVVEGLKDPATGQELPSFILRKKDGTSLYLSRDLVALKERIRLWHLHRVFIVVGKEQELHFQQLFALASKLGILNDEVSARHIDFGTVLSDGKKMSTRKGSLIELESLLKESVDKARGILKEKNSDLSEEVLNRNAEIIGVGAIIYNDLRQSRERNISFDWNRMLDFEGGSAAYLQYTCVRIGSILAKVEEGDIFPVVLEPVERSLLIKLAIFPKIIRQAEETCSPHHIATYLEELAQLFNTFYGSISVKDTKDDQQRKMRIQLIYSIRRVLMNGLAILNIPIPEKM